MTETTRTTVTLSEFNMSLVEDLIGILGNTKAQVISTIVEKFLQTEKNITLLEKLKEIKSKKELENKLEEAKKPTVIDNKIKNLIKGSTSIELKNLLEYLKIDIEFFYNHLPEWKDKYEIVVENKIIRFGHF